MRNIRIGCVTKVVYEEDTAIIRKIVRNNEIDLLVFPEMHDFTVDLGLPGLPEGESKVIGFEMNWAKQVGCAVVMGMEDDKGNIFNVFVNPNSEDDETPSILILLKINAL